jgi:hypothetical protein
MTIILVGEVHYDPQGYERMTKILERYRPRLITLEMRPDEWITEKDWKQTRNIGEKAIGNIILHYREHPELHAEATRKAMKPHWHQDTLERYLRGEIGTIPKVLEYAKTQHIRILPIDSFTNVTKRLMDEFIPEDFYEEEILTKTYEQLLEETEAHYGPGPTNQEFVEGMGLAGRDEHMAAHLRFQYQRGKDPILHLGGIDHHVAAYRNLYERLKDLEPERVRLCDADNF